MHGSAPCSAFTTCRSRHLRLDRRSVQLLRGDSTPQRCLPVSPRPRHLQAAFSPWLCVLWTFHVNGNLRDLLCPAAFSSRLILAAHPRWSCFRGSIPFKG